MTSRYDCGGDEARQCRWRGECYEARSGKRRRNERKLIYLLLNIYSCMPQVMKMLKSSHDLSYDLPNLLPFFETPQNIPAFNFSTKRMTGEGSRLKVRGTGGKQVLSYNSSATLTSFTSDF